MMITEERRAKILKKLRENRFVAVSNLASEFNVSSVTIRRDLDEMESEGLCVRKHGGAVNVNPGVTLEMPYDIKKLDRVSEKNRIAQKALSLINEGDTFILDSGSTSHALASVLKDFERITVITNDLKVAVKLAENPKINLLCTGGKARSSVYSLEGSVTEKFIDDLRVDKTFLGADAIHPNGVISNVNIQEVAIKKAMIRASDRVILLVDHSKFQRTGFIKVCNMDDIDVVITDDGITDTTRKMLDSHPVDTIIV